MTRGSAWYLTMEAVYESMEFNGDMYPDGLGDVFLKAVDASDSVEGFEEHIAIFNENHHNYDDEKQIYEIAADEFYDEIYDDEIIIDFSNNYFGRFFSDWVFFMNGSDVDILFIDRCGKRVVLAPGKSIRFNYGEFYQEVE